MARKIPNPRRTDFARIDEPKFKAYLRTRVIPWPVQKRYLRFENRGTLWYYRCRSRIPVQRSRSIEAPVFIIGSSRSGTGMLTRVLSASNQFCYFAENPLIRKYMITMLRHPEQIPHILPRQREAFLRLSGLRDGQVFLEKTPEHSLLVDSLALYYPNAHFLHIVRDGRDCALSMLAHDTIKRELSANWRPFWLAYLPQRYIDDWRQFSPLQRGLLRWGCFVSAARRAANNAGARYTETRYEDLCARPRVHIDRLLSALGQSMTPEIDARIGMISTGSVSSRNKQQLSAETKALYGDILDTFGLADTDDVRSGTR